MIDYTLMETKFAKDVTDCEAVHPAFDTDHRLLVARIAFARHPCPTEKHDSGQRRPKGKRAQPAKPRMENRAEELYARLQEQNRGSEANNNQRMVRAPWLTEDVMLSVRRKQEMYLKWRQGGSRQDFVLARRVARRAVKNAWNQYWLRYAQDVNTAFGNHDLATGYRLVTRLYRRRIPHLPRAQRDAEECAAYFHSLLTAVGHEEKEAQHVLPPPATTTNETPQIVAFTDGAALNNGKRDAKAAYGVYFGMRDPRNESGRAWGEAPQTNNRGELSGFLRALEIGGDAGMRIWTDSTWDS